MDKFRPGDRVKCIAPDCDCGGDTGTIYQKTFSDWLEQGEKYCCWDVDWDNAQECTFARENTIDFI